MAAVVAVAVDCAGRAQAEAITAPIAMAVEEEEVVVVVVEEETRVMIGREVCFFAFVLKLNDAVVVMLCLVLRSASM